MAGGTCDKGRAIVYSSVHQRKIGSLIPRQEGRTLILDQNGRPMATVHVCWSDSEADIVVSVLRAYGIEAITNSEVPHSVLPFTANGLGKVTVLVTEDLAAEAGQILAAQLEGAEKTELADEA